MLRRATASLLVCACMCVCACVGFKQHKKIKATARASLKFPLSHPLSVAANRPFVLLSSSFILSAVANCCGNITIT